MRGKEEPRLQTAYTLDIAGLVWRAGRGMIVARQARYTMFRLSVCRMC